MNKSEVCVKLTRKNCKKVLEILEKSLLDTKKVQATAWIPQVDKGFIRQAEQDGFTLHQTYTHEVWVNHYSDREFYIHKTKAAADEFSQGPGKVTVKATLTYDIPMTKV